jgi:hypothetical protein
MKLLFFIWLMLGCHFSQAQKIIETFMNIPDSVCPASKEHRSKVYQQFVSTLHDVNYHSFKIEKISASYMLLTGLFEGTWELKKWKINKHENLVGVSLTTCGPICSSELYFFREKAATYEFLPTEQVFPTIIPDDYYNISEMKRLNQFNSNDLQFFSSYSWTAHFLPRKKYIRINFEEIDSFDSDQVKVVYANKKRHLLIKKRNNIFMKD